MSFDNNKGVNSSIFQEDTEMVNVYASNNRDSKHMKQQLIGEIDNSTTEISTLLSQ